jgi:cell division protein FtsZ
MLKLDTNLDGMKFEVAEEIDLGTKIKVIGVGGAGGNAVARMMACGLSGVEFYVLNTDQQALQASPVPNKVALGNKVTNGLGAGADPNVGRQAALEDTERIIEILEGADMVFVTAGLGGGTGTGAAPVVASLAKELNALTVAVVTKPFEFEGSRRCKLAERGLAELAGTVDTVISIPNDRLLEIAPEDTSFPDALKIADDVLRQAVQGISDIITTPGLINRDFSDIKAIMLGMGYAMMGTATAAGKGAAVEAAQKAISSPLLEDGGVKGARGILINITSSSRLGLRDVNEACRLIREATAGDDVQINLGMALNESMTDEVKITVIATGFPRGARLEPPAEPMRVHISPRASDPMASTVSATAAVEPPIVEHHAIEPLPQQTQIFHQEYAQEESGQPAMPVVEYEESADSEPLTAAAAAGAHQNGSFDADSDSVTPMPTAPPVAMPAAPAAIAAAKQEPPPPTGLDVPAFLRRERRTVQ